MVEQEIRPICGVYILRDKAGATVYVGQSVNAVGRILAHATEGRLRFVSASILEMDKDDLSDAEGFLIRAIQPPGNHLCGTPTTRLCKKIHVWGGQKIEKKSCVLAKAQDVKNTSRPVIDLNIGSTSLMTTKSLLLALGGISDMTLWRWTKDKILAFPEPVYINRRRYWRECDVARWLESRGAL